MTFLIPTKIVNRPNITSYVIFATRKSIGFWKMPISLAKIWKHFIGPRFWLVQKSNCENLLWKWWLPLQDPKVLWPKVPVTPSLSTPPSFTPMHGPCINDSWRVYVLEAGEDWNVIKLGKLVGVNYTTLYTHVYVYDDFFVTDIRKKLTIKKYTDNQALNKKECHIHNQNKSEWSE